VQGMKTHSLHVGGDTCNFGCLSRAEAALELISRGVPPHVRPMLAGQTSVHEHSSNAFIHSQSMRTGVLSQSSTTQQSWLQTSMRQGLVALLLAMMDACSHK